MKKDAPTLSHSDGNEFQPSITKNGIFLTSNREGTLGGQDIFYARGKSDRFETPTNLGDEVNTKGDEISAYVTHDEVWMILATSRTDWQTWGNDDIHILKNVNGHWVHTENLMPRVNTFANEYGATLSPDGGWLYYTSDVNPRAKSAA